MIWPIKRRTTLSLPHTLIVIAIAIGVPVGVAVASHVPGAPQNDDYLDSFALNNPRDRLERTATLKDTQNTANASVQSDVFAHPGEPAGGGPPEPVACEGSSYGKTIWYDFYPDVPGVVRIRANGYDAVISVVPFRRATGAPQFGRRACINDSSSTQEELLTRVRKGRAYTIQLGGVNGASGDLEFLFDFLADTDNDGVLDDADNCPRLSGGGRPSGCPKRLRPEVVLRAAADRQWDPCARPVGDGCPGVARRGLVHARVRDRGEAREQRGQLPEDPRQRARGRLEDRDQGDPPARDRRLHRVPDRGRQLREVRALPQAGLEEAEAPLSLTGSRIALALLALVAAFGVAYVAGSAASGESESSDDSSGVTPFEPAASAPKVEGALGLRLRARDGPGACARSFRRAEHGHPG